MKAPLCGLLIALQLLCCAPPHSQARSANEAFTAPQILTMGIFPRRGASTTEQLFSPLVNEISKQLGIKVELSTTHDFASFWQSVANGEYDIVHYNQYHYVKSHALYGYQVIAQNVEFGHSKIAGAILVRSDSKIITPQDLKGKKIVFGGGRGAMQAYITATFLLRQAGLKKGDYFEHFALNPPKATIATFYQQASAAGAGNYVLDLPNVKKQIDTTQMRYLVTGSPMAHLPWAVKKTMSADIANKIRSIMIKLEQTEQGKAILNTARVTRFIPAEDKDYNPHREIIKQVLNEGF